MVENVHHYLAPKFWRAWDLKCWIPFRVEEIVSAAQMEHGLFSRITGRNRTGTEILCRSFCMDTRIPL